LRIGIVSGDLYNKAVGHFVEGVLIKLAEQGAGSLQLIAYHNHRAYDDLSERIRPAFAQWKMVAGVSDVQLAQQIRDDGIDILIDLSGHTANNRLITFASKPAPIQVTWLGFFGTTGVAEIDYILADEWMLPATLESYFTETIWRLPHTCMCLTVPSTPADVTPLPALTNGYVTFGCFNSLAKMTDEVVALWARVLHAVPNSRLFLKAAQLLTPAMQQLTQQRYAIHGIAADRLILEGPSPRAQYLAAFQRVDICLDPFPYTGCTTTAEGLWMGVPVLTLPIERFLSRQSVVLLMNAGLPEWIAKDQDDYAARAVAFSADLQALSTLRSNLRQRVTASPIFDAAAFAHSFEEALRAMWLKWCEAQ
jgi:predicted O-linked N-acetylglucosamine transferase (SPINDLY family)